jgi:hypothetical protein
MEVGSSPLRAWRHTKASWWGSQPCGAEGEVEVVPVMMVLVRRLVRGSVVVGGFVLMGGVAGGVIVLSWVQVLCCAVMCCSVLR